MQKKSIKKKIRRKKKGFTLIELLSVIIILGVLMIIAIPSVTSYIHQSRKRILTTTIGTYINSLVYEVNNLNYPFIDPSTIYAVPIECISVESGGTDPFGEWHQANDAYWAYVLVQYDTTKYIYGFTFKDSAGYGLYPITESGIKTSIEQLKPTPEVGKPVSGDLTSVAPLEKWEESGFKVNKNTNFIVLEAESEEKIGNGITTCTLKQKGNNYIQVEEDKKICTVSGVKTCDETPGTLAGDGTKKSPYMIESIEDLVAFSNIVNNKHIKQVFIV